MQARTCTCACAHPLPLPLMLMRAHPVPMLTLSPCAQVVPQLTTSIKCIYHHSRLPTTHHEAKRCSVWHRDAVEGDGKEVGKVRSPEVAGQLILVGLIHAAVVQNISIILAQVPHHLHQKGLCGVRSPRLLQGFLKRIPISSSYVVAGARKCIGDRDDETPHASGASSANRQHLP